MQSWVAKLYAQVFFIEKQVIFQYFVQKRNQIGALWVILLRIQQKKTCPLPLQIILPCSTD